MAKKQPKKAAEQQTMRRPNPASDPRLDDLCEWLSDEAFSAQCDRIGSGRQWVKRACASGKSAAYSFALAKVRQLFCETHGLGLVSNTAAAIRWQDATTIFPDDEITVLIADTEGDVTLGFHDGDSGWRSCSGERVADPVTFWADLPAPPTHP